MDLSALSFPILPYFKQAWPLISKLSVKSVKNKLVFHEICGDLGIELREDEFDFVYLQSLSILLLDQEHHDWASIFELPDVRAAFHTGYPLNDFDGTSRLLDHHLHTTIKKGPLKDLNSVPTHLLPRFAKIFQEQVRQNQTPSAMETIRSVTDAKDTLLLGQQELNDGITDMRGDLSAMKEILQRLFAPAMSGSFQNNSGYQDIIDEEHQAQLDFIKTLIEQKAIVTAQTQLLTLKDRILQRGSAAVKARLLNNIGYTYIVQNQPDEAIAYYEQALDFLDSDLPPVTNLVGLYFAKGRYAAAQPLVEKLAESHPGLSVALDIYLANEKNPATEPESLLPDAMNTNSEALVALINVYIKRNPRKALYYAGTLYHSAPDNDNLTDIYCNIALIALIGEKVDFETRELQSEADRQVLSEVRGLLEGLWAKFEPTEYKVFKVPLLVRLTLLLTVTGDQAAARKTAEQALALDPGNYHAKKMLGMNLMFSGEYEQAAATFDVIQAADDQVWEYLPAWMISRGKAGRMPEVLQMADTFLDRKDSIAEDHLRIYTILAFLLVEDRQFDQALETIDKVEKLFPDNLGVLADKARILRALNREEAAAAYVGKIVSLAQGDLSGQSIKDIYIAANHLCVTGNFKVAADLMATFVDTGSDSELTLQLADSYARSGRRAKALLIYENLRRKYGISKRYTRHEIEIYYYYRDYPKAIEVLEAYHEQYPDDFRWWLNLGGLYLKMNEQEKLKKFCRTELRGHQFSAEELEGYITILHSQGERDRCLVLAYDYRRRHPGPEANQLYIKYCLQDPLNAKDTEEFKTVRENAVVFLRDGSAQYHYIIEDAREEELIKNHAEISTEDKIFRQLKGKTVGSRVAFGNKGGGRRQWQITAIIPKYRFAFQEAMRENTTIYAAETGMFGGDVRNVADLEKFIDSQVQKADNLNQLIAASEEHYAHFQLPLGVFAGYNHKNPIAIYDYFIAKGTGIRYSTGNVDLYNQALQLAGANTVYVLDISGLLTLFKSGFTDEMPEKYRLVITPATRELIVQHIAEKTSSSQSDHISFFEHQGQKMRVLVSAQDKKAELVRLVDFRNWVAAHTETVPCRLLLQHDGEEDERFKRIFGADVLESALLSQELNGLYISDDAANRRFVDERYRIKSIWTQPLLKSWAAAGIISGENYNDIVHGLIKLGHQHTTVDTQDILLALKRSDYKIRGPFEALCGILSGKFSDDQSVRIAFAVITGILQAEISVRQKEVLSYFVLMTFISYRCLHPLLNRLSLHAPLSVRTIGELRLLNKVIGQLIDDIGI